MLHTPGRSPKGPEIHRAIDLEAKLRETDAKHDTLRGQYRQLLVDCERRSQAAYDKGVMTLSGGALAVSFSFVKTFLDAQTPRDLWSLGAAWACWVTSLALLLVSHYMSAGAFRWALEQHDSKKLNSGVRAGGWWDAAVEWLNAFAGIAFVAGAGYAGWFVYSNLR